MMETTEESLVISCRTLSMPTTISSAPCWAMNWYLRNTATLLITCRAMTLDTFAIYLRYRSSLLRRYCTSSLCTRHIVASASLASSWRR